MLKNQFSYLRPTRRFLVGTFAIGLMLFISIDAFGQQQELLLKKGGSYQAADDTSDRAVELYSQLIAQYPGTREAEAAQFATGGYYSRKFFILERRENVQSWDSFNKAEEALYKYVWMYKEGVYAADAYNVLAMIALRRGYKENATKLWSRMREVAAKDSRVYVSRETWPTTDDVIRGYCDAGALAQVGLSVAEKPSFDEASKVLTDWVQNNCSDIRVRRQAQ